MRGIVFQSLCVVGVAALMSVACGGGGGGAAAVADGGRAAAPAPAPAPEPVAEVAFEGWCGDGDCPCEEGTVQQHADGGLKQCDLAEPTEIQGAACVDARASFSADGHLLECFAAPGAEVAGIPCREKMYLRFHPDGSFQTCINSERVTVDGVLCAAGSGVELHPDGSLRRCTLAEAHSFAGVAVPAGPSVTLKDGALYRLDVFTEPVELGDVSCKGNFNFLHANGQVAKCTLGAAAQIAGEELEEGAKVCFDDSGAVADCSAMRFDLT